MLPQVSLLLDGCLTFSLLEICLSDADGILGIGASMMGAGFVKLVEADPKLCKLANANAESMLMTGKYEVCNQVIGEHNLQSEGYDLIISNPPWGRQREGADSAFFEHILKSFYKL